MIKNARQYRITKAQAEKFAQALVRSEQAPGEQALGRDAAVVEGAEGRAEKPVGKSARGDYGLREPALSGRLFQTERPH